MPKTITTSTIVEDGAWKDFQLWCAYRGTTRSRVIRNIVIWILTGQLVIPPELLASDSGEYDYESTYTIQN
jgi:hypothetical protein